MENQKYKLIVQSEFNRVYLTLKGFITDGEVRKIIEEVGPVIFEMAPGFAFILDISDNALSSNNVQKDIQKAMAMVRGSDVGVLIRVIGNNVLGSNYLKLRHGVGHEDVHVFKTMEEAEKFLIKYQASANSGEQANKDSKNLD